MNTLIETIDNLAATVKSIASEVRDRVGYKWGCLVEDHGTYVLIRFPEKRSIRIPSIWIVTEHPIELRRKVEELVEATLR